LSVHTVRDHVKRLYDRAGVGGRPALMALINTRRPVRADGERGGDDESGW
jgi:hypothetical protein